MSLKNLVNTPAIWNAFTDELQEQIAIQHKQLEQLTDPHQVGQAQGEIRAYRKLLKLRDKVNGPKD